MYYSVNYAKRLTRFLESLYCCACKKRNLFGRLSCLAFDDTRANYYLAWCNDCKVDGLRVLKPKRRDLDPDYPMEATR